jgi:hypothetical protein
MAANPPTPTHPAVPRDVVALLILRFAGIAYAFGRSGQEA